MATLKISNNSLLLMGILNVTPDSFSDGGKFNDPIAAVEQAQNLLQSGADLIDLGAESTRPGAELISAELEWKRLEPVLEILKPLKIPLSLDTHKAEVAAKALDFDNIQIINDASGLADPEMAPLLAQHTNTKLVINHHFGLPAAKHHEANLDTLIDDVCFFFEERLEKAFRAGLQAEQLILDPGLGFGKGLKANLKLVQNLPTIKQRFGLPLLIGPSRKRFIKELWPDAGLDWGSMAVSLWAAQNGASIIRCHTIEPYLALKKIHELTIQNLC